MALGVDKNDGKSLMRCPPRKAAESLFARGGMACTLLYGALITGIGLAAFLVLPCGILAGRGELSWNLSDWVEGLRELLSREKYLPDPRLMLLQYWECASCIMQWECGICRSPYLP